MLTTTQHMRVFMAHYITFSETGENPLDFQGEDGLCVEKFRYLHLFTDMDFDEYIELLNSMTNLLEELLDGIESIDDGFPFGRDDYQDRYRNRTQHKCPMRLAFIRTYLAKTELENV